MTVYLEGWWFLFRPDVTYLLVFEGLTDTWQPRRTNWLGRQYSIIIIILLSFPETWAQQDSTVNSTNIDGHESQQTKYLQNRYYYSLGCEIDD